MAFIACAKALWAPPPLSLAAERSPSPLLRNREVLSGSFRPRADIRVCKSLLIAEADALVHLGVVNRLTASSVLDAIGAALLLIGFSGFVTCWLIEWNAETRILGDSRFDHPTPETPSVVAMKGRTFFVERSYARRIRLADDLISPFWGIGAAGMIMRGRKEFATKWRNRRYGKPYGVSISSNQPQEAHAVKTESQSFESLGWVACAGLFVIWGALPAVVGIAVMVVWLVSARLFRRL